MSSPVPSTSYRITAKLPDELIVKVAENLHYKDNRKLIQTITSDRVDGHRVENGLSTDTKLDPLPEALKRPSPLENMLSRLVERKRDAQIAEEWQAGMRRCKEEEEREAKCEHPYLRRVSK